MRRLFLAYILLLAGILCLSQNEHVSAFWQSRDSNYNVSISSGASYIGPGDAVSGAAVDWSCTFAYNAAYAAAGGNMCVLVDAATGLISYTLTALSNGKANFAGAAASTACSVACVVSEMYDQTGNGVNMISSSLSNDLPYTFNAIGSLAAIVVSSTGQVLSATAPGNASTWTIFAESANGNLSNSGKFFYDNTALIQLLYDTFPSAPAINAGATLDSSACADTNLHAIIAAGPGSSTVLRCDTTETTGNAGTNTIASGDGLRIGNGMQSGGIIGEIGYYASTLNSTQRGTLQSNMAARY